VKTRLETLSRRKARGSGGIEEQLLRGAGMKHHPHFIPLVPHALILACLFAGGQIARAQEEEEDAPLAPRAVAAPPAFILQDAQFDQWVFNGRANSSSARARLESLLMLQVEDIDRSCSITDAQKKKLALAGRGDINRFLDRVDEKRAKYLHTRQDPNKVNDIFQEIRPLQLAFNAGLFKEGSLFWKAIPKTLTDEQLASFEQAQAEKRSFRYRARAELVAANLGNSLGLSTDQRKRFIKVLLEETRPPRNFGSNEYQVVLHQAAKIPQDKLKPIFDETQWRALNRSLMQSKAMERILKESGYVPDDGEEHGAKGQNGEPKNEE
jgi:hypothetical protein